MVQYFRVLLLHSVLAIFCEIMLGMCGAKKNVCVHAHTLLSTFLRPFFFVDNKLMNNDLKASARGYDATMIVNSSGRCGAGRGCSRAV